MHKPLIRLVCILIAVIVLFLLLSGITYSIDHHRANNGQRPLFAIAQHCDDGGTAVYYGLGYQIIFWHRMAEDSGYMVGTEIHYGCNFNSGEPPADLTWSAE